MKQEYRPLLAGSALLAFAVALLLFLNYTKFGATLENRERARHALLAEHLAKTIDARLALGLPLENTTELQAILKQELTYDSRLRAIVAFDADGTLRIVDGHGQPDLWRAACQAQGNGGPMPSQNDAGSMAVALHNDFGAAAGCLVMEYDLRGTRRQSWAALAAAGPMALLTLLGAIALLAVLVPRMVRRHADRPARATRRISLLVAVLLVLVHCLIAWSAYHTFARVSREDAPRLAETLAHTLTPGLERALDHGIPLNELRGVDEWLQPALASGPEFAGLSIDDTGGRRLFDVSDAHRRGTDESVYGFPLQYRGQTVGRLVVTLDLLPLAERSRQLAMEFITLLVISILISMEVLPGLLARAIAGNEKQALGRLKLPLFLFFAGSELPRAFLPMWAKQLAQQPLPPSWSGTVLSHAFAPFAHLPEAVRATLPISLFLLTVALVSPFAGRYSARHGPIRVLQFGLLLALFGHLLAMLSASLLSLCLARALAGASSGFITVAAFDYIGRDGARARGMALYLSAYVAAGICGAGLGALLVDRAGTAAVFCVGMVCTVLAGAALVGLPDLEQPGSKPVPLVSVLGQLLRQPRFLRLLILIGLPMQILQQGLLFYWAPLALTAQGEPTSFVGLTMMAYFFLVLLLNAPAAHWADQSGRHTGIALACLAIAGAAGIFGGVLYTSTAIAISVALIGVIWAAGFPAQGALILKLGEGRLAGVAPTVTVGVYRMIERIGAMLAPPLIALLAGVLGYADTAKLIGAVLISCALLQGLLVKLEKKA